MIELLNKKEVLHRLLYWAQEANKSNDPVQYKQTRRDTFLEARIVVEDEVPIVNSKIVGHIMVRLAYGRKFNSDMMISFEELERSLADIFGDE